MSDNSSSEIGAFLSGFVIGGLVGAAVALILAPQSGEETRTLIHDRGIELRDRAMESAEDVRKRAEEAAAQARTRAEELQAKSKTLIEEQRGKITAIMGQKPAAAPAPKADGAAS